MTVQRPVMLPAAAPSGEFVAPDLAAQPHRFGVVKCLVNGTFASQLHKLVCGLTRFEPKHIPIVLKPRQPFAMAQTLFLGGQKGG
jgi:hypothetical protein